MGQVEDEFHSAMLRVYDRARDECGYRATYFLRMVQDLGGVEAAKRLLYSEDLSYGFEKLWELGRLDISMETLAIQPGLEDCGYSQES